MAQPLYFLPNLRKAQFNSIPLAREVLAARGLTEVFADVPFGDAAMPCFEPSTGPGGLAGLLLCYQTPDGRIPDLWRYLPAEQVWTPVGDGSQVWIGYQKSSPPTEADLRRRKQYPGYRIELGDERWLVPVIRRADNGETLLPRDSTWDAAGNYIEPVKPAYQGYWDASREVADWFYTERDDEGTQFGGPTYSPAKALELAVNALGINYRYGRAEHCALRVIDADSVLALLACTVDLSGVMERSELQKKSNATPGTVSFTPG